MTIFASSRPDKQSFELRSCGQIEHEKSYLTTKLVYFIMELVLSIVLAECSSHSNGDSRICHNPVMPCVDRQ
jgi:hypothetical protein